MSALAQPSDDEPRFRFPLPRIKHVPTLARRNREMTEEALWVVGDAGLILDPWEEYVLQHSLRIREDGKWGALEVGLTVPRQNGKGSVLEARELIALFIDAKKWPEVAARLTVHSAHEAKTAHEGFERLQELILDTPRLKSKLRGKPRQSEGGEVIQLLDGRRIRFRTRTSGGGRGLSGDLLIFDEAMILSETTHRAVWSIVTARPNPQIWYTGSAVDQQEPLMAEHGIVFSRVRQRGIDGDPDLAYFEWSHEADSPDQVTKSIAQSPEVWRAANPGLGIRLSERVISVEQRSLSPRGFAVERLGVGDWHDPATTGRAIDLEAWAACEDHESEMLDPVCLSIDVTPDRARACVAAAGRRRDGLYHVEVIEHARSTSWVGSLLSDLSQRSRPLSIVLSSVGAAGALLPRLEEEYGFRVAAKGFARGAVIPVTQGEMTKACGAFYDEVDQRRLRHLPDPLLDAAVSSATRRPLGDAWAWDRKNSTGDISPLVACTLALWGVMQHRSRGSLVLSLVPEGEAVEEDVREDLLPDLEPQDFE